MNKIIVCSMLLPPSKKSMNSFFSSLSDKSYYSNEFNSGTHARHIHVETLDSIKSYVLTCTRLSITLYATRYNRYMQTIN